MSLIECLSTVKDSRRLQGQRYHCVAMLLIIIMAILRNKHGYREIGRFCELNKRYLIAKFGFKNNKVPSYVCLLALCAAHVCTVQVREYSRFYFVHRFCIYSAGISHMDKELCSNQKGRMDSR